MKVIAFLALASTALATNPVVPQPFTKTRYDQTRANSPFVLATPAVTENTAPKTRFTANMYVVGLGRADGREYVTLIRLGEESSPIRLWGDAPGPDGITVRHIAWSDTFGKSKVTLAKDGIEEQIGFNENALKASGSAPPIPVNKQHNGPDGKQPPTNKGNRIRVIH
ncbi:MAG: hypothetical protein RL088_4001 [Verrucomicrobiota bacterium]|jgi:hypothetical protein